MEHADEMESESIRADFCIVGAGPAGLTVAAELIQAGRDVIVLEAGGASYDRHDRSNLMRIARDHLLGAQSLARGKGTGEPYYPLRMSRARGLGGSSNALLSHGLRARPLDEVDLGPRLGRSWPFSYQEFASFLPTAEIYAGIRGVTEEPTNWDQQNLDLGGTTSSTVVAAPFRHGDRMAFPNLARSLAYSTQVRIVTAAAVVGFQLAPGGRVLSVDVASAKGRRFRVAADTFVLATGGIDNARLILASRPLLYQMDSAADHVGRHFMEHLHFVAGYLIPESPEAAIEIRRLFEDAQHPACWLTPSETSPEVLRAGFAAVPVLPDSLHPAVPAFGELVRIAPVGPYGRRARLRQAITALRGIDHVFSAVGHQLTKTERTIFALPAMVEQAPDPSSRVTLLARSDRTGVPLPLLHWQVGRRDFADARRSLEVVADEFERRGLGTVRSLWDMGGDRPDVVTGGWHHMGTTIMSTDSHKGVVDHDCRLHGVDNLYVAGSSVFPTSGYANPTLTLVALAVRLGRYLAAER